MKKFIALNIFIFTYLIGYTQIKDTIMLRLTEFQWVAFVSEDSIYEFTRFIEPEGKFTFSFGFEDSCFTYSSRKYQLDNKGKFLGTYDLDYKYTFKSIDTIYNYFPIKEQKINTSKHIPYELVASYIMKQLSEPEIINSDKNIIRILYPCDNLNYSLSFQIFKIQFTEHSSRLDRITGISKDYNGIQLIQKDSARMKERDFRRIEKQLKKINNVGNWECRDSGNPWILEYNINGEYKRFIISDYCARGKREFKPLTLLVSSIIGTSRNYFGMWCNQ